MGKRLRKILGWGCCFVWWLDGETVAEKTWEGGLFVGFVVVGVCVVGVFVLVEFLKKF